MNSTSTLDHIRWQEVFGSENRWKLLAILNSMAVIVLIAFAVYSTFMVSAVAGETSNMLSADEYKALAVRGYANPIAAEYAADKAAQAISARHYANPMAQAYAAVKAELTMRANPELKVVNRFLETNLDALSLRRYPNPLADEYAKK